jgi:hypothetical protein
MPFSTHIFVRAAVADYTERMIQITELFMEYFVHAYILRRTLERRIFEKCPINYQTTLGNDCRLASFGYGFGRRRLFAVNGVSVPTGASRVALYFRAVVSISQVFGVETENEVPVIDFEATGTYCDISAFISAEEFDSLVEVIYGPADREREKLADDARLVRRIGPLLM